MPPQDRSTQHDIVVQLQHQYNSLRHIERDVYAVKEFLTQAQRQKAAPCLCFDFDVLYSFAVSEIDSDSSEVFWATLSLNLPGFQAIALPGTLLEILLYFERRQKTIMSVDNSPFGSALIRSIENAPQSSLRVNQKQYSQTIKYFLGININEPDLFLFHLLQDKFQDFHPKIPEINKQLFYAAVMHLSRKNRSETPRNNKIDAFNYCVIDALNANEKNEHIYVFVSNSGHVRSLDELNRSRHALSHSLGNATKEEIVEEFIATDPDQVWTPRRAAILQLLAAAGGTIDKAVQHAWILISSIARERAETANLMADPSQDGITRLVSANLEFSGSRGVFLSLIGGFSGFKRRIDEASDRKNVLDIAVINQQLVERSDNSVAFLEKVQKGIQQTLISNGYQFSLDSYLPRSVSKMEIRFLDNDPRFKYEFRAKIAPAKAASEEEACVYFRYSNGHLIAVNGTELLDEFIGVYNALTRNIILKLSLNELHSVENPPRSAENDFKIVAGTENGFLKSSDQTLARNLSIEGLSSTFNTAIGGINFLRIDNPLFNASFEGAITIISSRYPLLDEFAFFVQGLTRVPYRGTDFRRPIAELVNR